jgi:poly-gamma-glutamate synthesis protein (capsule biosynthesis protein)
MDVNILITGDYCPIGRNQKSIEKGDYTSFFGDFVDVCKNVDYAVTNLESPVTKNKTPILKSGPNIKGPLDSLKPLKKLGFNLVTLANNHILDFGEEGVKDTISNCYKEGIDTLGAGSSLKQARTIFYKEIKGKLFAFINITENEFCAATKTTYGANPLNLIQNQKDIIFAKKKADYVIVIAHGGREHYQLPTPSVRDRYRFFIDSGADVVVAHHPHCYSGYETYNTKKIFYSLGNFIFDYKLKYQKGSWTEGMSIILKFSERGIDFDLIPFFQGRSEDPTLKLMQGKDRDVFNLRIKKLNKNIENDKLFFDSWEAYINSQIKNYNGLLFIRNTYLRFAVIKGLVPFFNLASNKRKALLLNLLRCESHREIMIDVLKKEIKL